MAQTVDVDDPSEAGAAALQRGDWDIARARFEAAAAAGDAPAAWEGLSRAAWWQSDAEATFAARERAYRGYRDAGDPVGAARMAAWVGIDHVDFRGDDAVAAAWLRRARGELGEREPCAEHVLIALFEADIALLHHADAVSAVRIAEEALELARSVAARDLELVATAILGSALIAAGEVVEGVRRLDEAAAMAVGEDYADALAPGWALCHTVSSCTDVGEFGRAAQWSRTMHGFSLRWSSRHFFGVCRTAYGAVLATHGDWPTAEQELTSAMDDLRATRPGLAAPTAVRLGQLRVRQGRTDEARRLFESALPHAQAVVAIGELDLAAGDADAAVEAADRVLRRLGAANPLERFPALELLARARARAGDAEAAAAAVAELRAEGERLTTGYLRARATLVARRGAARGARPRRRPPRRRGCGRPLRRVLGPVRGGDGPAGARGRPRRPRARGAG